MTSRTRDKVHEAPLHVLTGDDGTVRVLLPDGHSLTMSVEAAERSALLLSCGAVRTREARPKPATGTKVPAKGKKVVPAVATVIAVDFVHHQRLH
jgi:hypothetical protein